MCKFQKPNLFSHTYNQICLIYCQFNKNVLFHLYLMVIKKVALLSIDLSRILIQYILVQPITVKYIIIYKHFSSACSIKMNFHSTNIVTLFTGKIFVPNISLYILFQYITKYNDMKKNLQSIL